MESRETRQVDEFKLVDDQGKEYTVRLTPNSDRESGHPQAFMSALLPKADMCSALAHVC